MNIRPPSPVSEGAPAGQAEAARPEPPEVVAPSHVEKPPEQMQVNTHITRSMLVHGVGCCKIYRPHWFDFQMYCIHSLF